MNELCTLVTESPQLIINDTQARIRPVSHWNGFKAEGTWHSQADTTPTPVHEIYDAFLIAKTMKTLISMGDSRPKTVAKLENCLRPLTRVLEYSSLPDILSMYKMIDGEPVSVIKRHRLTTADQLTNELLKWAFQEAENKGAAILLSNNKTTSDKEKWKKLKKTLTFQDLCDACFDIHKVNNGDSVYNTVIENLQTCGYLTVDSGEDGDTVKYNLPPKFIISCLKHSQIKMMEKETADNEIICHDIEGKTVQDMKWENEIKSMNSRVRRLLLASTRDNFESNEALDYIHIPLGEIRAAVKAHSERKRRRRSRTPSRTPSLRLSKRRRRPRRRSRTHSRSLSHSRSRSRSPLYANHISRSRSSKRFRKRSLSRSRSRSPPLRSNFSSRSRSPPLRSNFSSRSRSLPLRSSLSRSRSRSPPLRSNFSSRSRSPPLRSRFSSRSRSPVQTELYGSSKLYSGQFQSQQSMNAYQAVSSPTRRSTLACIKMSPFWMSYPQNNIQCNIADLKKVNSNLIPQSVCALAALVKVEEKPATKDVLKEFLESQCHYFQYTPLVWQKALLNSIIIKPNKRKESFNARDQEIDKIKLETEPIHEKLQLDETFLSKLAKEEGLVEESYNEEMIKTVLLTADKTNSSLILTMGEDKMSCFQRIKSWILEMNHGEENSRSAKTDDVMETDDINQRAGLTQKQLLQKLFQSCISKSEIPVIKVVERLKKFGYLDIKEDKTIEYNINQTTLEECESRCAATILHMNLFKGSLIPSVNNSTDLTTTRIKRRRGARC